jgi:hypothetical protein
VFIEPSPYEIATLLATVVFLATGTRLRLIVMPLLLLLFLLNVGYTIAAVAVMDRPNVTNWVATSWYMAVTVVFFAMVVSEDTQARRDMLRRGLVFGAMIAALRYRDGSFLKRSKFSPSAIPFSISHRSTSKSSLSPGSSASAFSRVSISRRQSRSFL